MARKKTSKPKPKPEAKPSFLCPSLHQDVVDAVSDAIPITWFRDSIDDEDCEDEYETHIMGTFECNNKSCSSRRWSSKMVTILIRGYPGNGYNAEIFNQRCKSCNQLGTLTPNKKSYVDRVSYRLKRWAGVPVEKQTYIAKPHSRPHESSLCEGCKRGFCLQTDDLYEMLQV